MEKFASTTAPTRLLKKEAASCLRAIVRKRLFYLLSLLAVALPWQCLAGYVPPVGIPTPPFGIDEQATMYSGKTYTFTDSRGKTTYPDAGNGPYSHYVDNTATGATDSNNPYGTPTKPRLTIPTTLAPGSVVEVHGGPYDASVGNNFLPAVNGWAGTSGAPIFIRGYSVTSKPIVKKLTQALNFVKGCTYLIIENIHFSNTALEIRQTSNHVSLRYCEFDGVPVQGYLQGAPAIFLWSDSGGAPTDYEDYIVIYQCEIHNNSFPPSASNGVHGVLISNGARNVWVLNSQIYDNGSDMIQVYWQDGRNQPSAENVYIGGNQLYVNLPGGGYVNHTENATDIKQSNNVIISSNDMHGFRGSDDGTGNGSDGSAVVLNNDDPSKNLWVINNHIYDSTIGIRNQSPNTVYIVGNLIEEIHHEAGQTYTGITSKGTGYWNDVGSFSSHPEYTRNAYVVNNTFYHTDQGMIFDNGVQYYAENNIVSEMNYKDGTVWHLARNNGLLTVKNNLLFQTGTAPIIRQSSNVYYSAATFDKVGLGSGDLAGDPLFITPGTNFALQDKSPAIGAGTVSSVYATFQSLFGRSIAIDRNGVTRPVSGWDIGAYEFGTGSELPPQPPANLHIITPP